MRRRRRTARRLLVLAGALAACATIFATVSMMRGAAREALIAEARIDGMQAHQDGRYTEALPHLAFFVTHNRTDVDVLMAFAEARAKVPLENNRHLREAARIYGVVVDLQPQNIDAHLLLMHLNERLHRRLEWHEAAERVLALDGRNVDALRAKATALYLDSRFDEAGAICSRLIALEPDEVTWRVFYLQIKQDRGDSIASILQTCRTWIDWHETDGRYHMLKARILTAIGRHEEARRLAMAAAERGANEPLILEHLVVLLDALSLHDQATQLIEATKQRFPREQWAYEASVRRHWKAGDYERAIAEIAHVSAEHDRLGGGLLRWKTLLQAFADEYEDKPRIAFDTSVVTPAEVHGRGDRDTDQAWAKAAAAKADLEAANIREAIGAYRQALALKPNDPVLHYLMGEAYARAGEHHLAAASLEHAVRSDQGWLTAQRLYAQTLLRLERYDEAARLAVRLMQRASDPDIETCLVLARAWHHANMSPHEIGMYIGESSEPATLAQFLEHVIDQAPANPDIIELLALSHLREGNRDRATALIESIIQSVYLTDETLARVSRISEAHNLQLEAKIVQAGAERLGPSSQLAMLRARLLHRLGQSEAALQLVDQAPRASLKEAMARAGYLAWVGHPDAVDALHDVLERAEDDVQSISFVLSQPVTWDDAALARRAIDLLQGVVGQDAPRVALARATYALQFQAGDSAAIAQAMLMTNRVLSRTPESLSARRLMSMLYLAADPPDVEAAIRQLTRAIETHPRRVELYPRIIRLLQRQGDHIAADLYLRQMGRLVGQDQSLLHAELLLLEAQGDFDSVIARLSGSDGVFDDVAQQLALASTWHRAGNSAQASVLLDQLLAAEPDNPAVLSMAVQVHADNGRIEAALALLHDYEARVESGVSAMLLGIYAERSGRIEEATQWLRTALERSPDRLEIWHQLASHYLTRGRFAEARTVAEGGLRSDPEHVGLLTTFVTASIHLGGQERRAALRLLDTVDCRAEALVDTLHHYDRVLAAAEHGEYSSFLLEDLRYLVQRHPEVAQPWRLAITTHVQAGRLEEAVSLARHATGRIPTTGEFAELATHLLISLNQLSDALEMARVWRDRTLHQPLAADAVIAALQLDLQQGGSAANQLSRHAERIVRERQQSPQRLALLIHAYAADRRFEQLSQIASPVLHEDDRWVALLLDLAQAAPDEDAEILQQLARTSPDGGK